MNQWIHEIKVQVLNHWFERPIKNKLSLGLALSNENLITNLAVRF